MLRILGSRLTLAFWCSGSPFGKKLFRCLCNNLWVWLRKVFTVMLEGFREGVVVRDWVSFHHCIVRWFCLYTRGEWIWHCLIVWIALQRRDFWKSYLLVHSDLLLTPCLCLRNTDVTLRYESALGQEPGCHLGLLFDVIPHTQCASVSLPEAVWSRRPGTDWELGPCVLEGDFLLPHLLYHL